MAVTEENWWKKAVIYQIYPRSFYDASGDGIGDLKGITKKLDYIKGLGANGIWLCPVLRSPMCDNGYDISDYRHVDPVYGSDADMEELIRQARERGIRVVMDMVVNHCSDEHEWFQRAKRDPEGKYGGYFYLRKSADGQLPNNWRSVFGGSAWEPISGTPYYYLHTFGRKQVDLNWENRELREEIYRMMNEWLDKGIAGFRMDAITYLKKAEGLSSFPADGEDGLVSIAHGSLNREGIGVFLREMQSRTYGRYHAMTVGEASGIGESEMLRFISQKNGYFSMIFDFSYCQLNLKEPNYFWHETRKWAPEELKSQMFHSQRVAGSEGWFGLCLENHDMPRAIDHYLAADGQNYYGASMLAAMYLLLRGTPYVYQGQELGMRNCGFASIEEYDDCSSKNQYREARSAGYGHQEAMEFVRAMSRDNARTPFPWSGEAQAGFTTGVPWLLVNPDYRRINAQRQMEDPGSLFHWYQALIRLRTRSAYADVLTEGELEPVYEELENVIAYKRRLGRQCLLVLCNYQGSESCVPLGAEPGGVIMDNYGEMLRAGRNAVKLRAYEALVLELEETRQAECSSDSKTERGTADDDGD